MKKMLKNIAFVSMLGLATQTFAANTTGIAVVNLNQVFQQVPEGQPAFVQLQKQFAPQASNLQQQQNSLNKAIQSFESDKAKLSQTQQTDQQNKLIAQQQKLQQSVSTYQNDFKQKQQQLLTTFNDNLKAVATKIAKTNKYQVVLTNQAVIYNDDSLDITPQVIQGMKKS